MLKRLYVDNFSCLSNFEFKPAQVSLLVGPNGGGKSTVLTVLAALQGFLNGGKDVKDEFPRFRLTRWDQRLDQLIEIDVEIEGEPFSYSLKISYPELPTEMPKISDERLTHNGQLLYRLADGQIELFGDKPSSTPRTTFPFSPVRSFMPMLEPRPDNARIMSFRTWMSRMWLFSLIPQGQNINPISEAEATALSGTGHNFVSWYRYLAQESPDSVRRKLIEDLQSVVPGLQEIRLQTLSQQGPGQATKSLFLVCTIGSKDFPLAVSELSDGQRALLMLYAVLHAIAKDASLLFFDEPDNFVAHGEIQPWLSALRDAVVKAKRGTLIVASHHPEVIDYLAPDQTLRLWRGENGPTQISEVDFSQVQDLSASEYLNLGIGEPDGE